ncbi:pyrroloquinoline quinone biosynthesis peptide chaperone PqqD [Acetobacter suratthaniensis]|nr:pyrroloquinoline quinone biosynthesis peptide chaperone PqqD [Acetobacter suratthaniensis]MCX2565990.1 pyrroloquinoline quinone biosynthesis peptide chaperone PqqD [Acetobacter suratthaniensis]
MTGSLTPPPMTEDCVPRFARGTRLQYDRVRETWFIQAPERAFLADAIAVEVLQLVDGARALAVVIDTLAEKFDAPRTVITQDVLTLVNDLAARQVLVRA